MSNEVRCVAAVGDLCGEGAVWHPEEKALYWTDINRFLVHRYDPRSELTRTWFFEEPVTTVNLTTDPARLLLVLGSRVALWSPDGHPDLDTLYRLAQWPVHRFNDAGIDPRGRLWAGTMRNNVGANGEELDVEFTGGELYRIDPDGQATVWKRGIGISNTVVWSPDGSKFYFGDTTANRIGRFEFDGETGGISGEVDFLAGHEQGVPDGSAMDEEGYVWNARPEASCVIRVAPDGTVVRTVQLPVSRPTTCAFGGEGRRTLFITSIRAGERLSGCLFAMEPGVAGLAEHRFKLG